MSYRKPLAEEMFDARQAWIEADDQFLTEQDIATGDAIFEVENKFVRAMRRTNKMVKMAQRKLARAVKQADREL